MCAPSPPKPPDPQETAAAQTGTNVSTAIANTMLGNVNQVGADGSTLDYDQTGSYSWTDPSSGASYDIPTFTATTSLSDDAQGIFDTNMQTQGNLADLGAQQSEFLGGYLSDPFSYSPGEHESWAMGLYEDINGDQVARDRAAMEAQLANQGVVPGSEAYDAAMSNLLGGQQTARDRFMLDSYDTGLNTAMTERSQPINEIAALLSGGQINMPQFAQNQPSGIPTTDFAGLTNANFNQQQQNHQQEMANYNNIMGGLFNLGSSAIMASDIRIKEDIRRVGETDGGLPVYTYRYKGGSVTHMGVMAQDVERVDASAVHDIGKGIKGVDYRKVK